MKILGVGRAPQFSPNSVDRDAAILTTVKEQLELSGGHEVLLIDERELTAETLAAPFDRIFSMSRSAAALHLEAEAERSGTPVQNSARGRLQLNRRALLTLCREKGIPVPDYATADRPIEEPPFAFPFWMKRDDRTTQQAGDVRFVADSSQWDETMQTVREQGIAHYILEQHIPGDLIKFYSVAGTAFFHHSYPTRNGGFSKFGTENINGRAQGFAFNVQELKQKADQLATAAGITVYGGDAVVQPDGRFFLIDFNDWPSFSVCRKEAARAIAACVEKPAKPTDKR